MMNTLYSFLCSIYYVKGFLFHSRVIATSRGDDMLSGTISAARLLLHQAYHTTHQKIID